MGKTIYRKYAYVLKHKDIDDYYIGDINVEFRVSNTNVYFEISDNPYDALRFLNKTLAQAVASLFDFPLEVMKIGKEQTE